MVSVLYQAVIRIKMRNPNLSKVHFPPQGGVRGAHGGSGWGRGSVDARDPGAPPSGPPRAGTPILSGCEAGALEAAPLFSQGPWRCRKALLPAMGPRLEGTPSRLRFAFILSPDLCGGTAVGSRFGLESHGWGPALG